jgi:putative DNA primase/helicase
MKSVSATTALPQESSYLASCGWKLFPIEARTKHGALVKWGTEATSDITRLEEWAARWPGCNWGVATGQKSGIFAIDLDGAQGHVWATETNLPSDTLITATGREGGFQVIYQQPLGITTKTSAGVAPGVDVRGDGGMIVLPPSIHPNGTQYQFVKWVQPSAAPDWLVGLVTKTEQPSTPAPSQEPCQPATEAEKAYGANIMKKACAEFAAIIPGQGKRNAGAVKLAYTIAGVVAAGWLEHDVAQAAIAEVTALYRSQDSSGVKTLNSGWSDGLEKPLPPLPIDAVAEEVRQSGFTINGQTGFTPAPLPTNKMADAMEYHQFALETGFHLEYGENLRYTPDWNKWHRWNGQRWQTCEVTRIYDMARKICKKASIETPQSAAKYSTAASVAAIEVLARANPRHAATVTQWDENRLLLNTQGGCLDLEHQRYRASQREDYCTKLTAVAVKDGRPALWLQFLARCTNNDYQFVNYLQRACGYFLTGSTEEHAMFFVYGTGGNGKSVFLNTIAGILGDYAKAAAMSTFIASKSDQHPTDLAALMGARLVIASEVDQGRSWDEAKVKALTGGDRITARFMRQDFFEFQPQFKLLIAGNHKPALRGVDEAWYRRLHILPFTQTIPASERDPELLEKLKAEWPVILGWMVRGYDAWRMEGLSQPEVVKAETKAYLAAQDSFGQWLEEKCDVGVTNFARTNELFESWEYWSEDRNEFKGQIKLFCEKLESRGFRPDRRRIENSNPIRGYAGIRLKT